jgi:hypothetical protein
MRSWLVLLAFLPIAAQDTKTPPLDQAAIDKAIDAGAEFLKKRFADAAPPPPMGMSGGYRQGHELMLYALLHAGVSEKDPVCEKLLASCVQRPIWATYNVALLAMVLQKLDPAKHRDLLLQCAQFFADTQKENGQWGYGPGHGMPNDRRALTSPARCTK